ncbi:MAG: hypothetical protein L6R39_007424 [Caloplaca ligustica]|nr:MAG: hypothetical protein L6R39_007424 [Caloplaca ligustica]
MEHLQEQLRILRPMLPTYLHLVASALLPIYAGAHASLARPSSAAKPSKSKEGTASKDDAEENSEEESTSKIEGLSASDALWFPLLAGCTLGGLYLIIKWLEDPSILNKILNWYFAVFGIIGVARLFEDILNIITSFIFPSRHLHRGQTWEFDNSKRAATSDSDPMQSRTSPFAGALSSFPLPAWLNHLFWSIRASYPTLCIRLSFRPSRKIHAHITPSKSFSGVAALVLVLYYNLVSRPWYLTNILGFAFAYNALQLISPTTSSTGTLILASLFLYDIYFVFYTPLMVTVATSLDIPAKLLFPRPAGPEGDPAKQHLSMLGLGDVVLPGMMIGFALRMDLYLHYLKQQKSLPIVSANGDKASSPEGTEDHMVTNKNEPNSITEKKMSASHSTSATDPSTSTQIIIKPSYHPATGHWGDRFWLSSFSHGSPDHPSIAGTKFPKPYFHASLQGYIFGMFFTLGAMQVTGVAQPALFYLVPCVLINFWGMAAWRRELRLVWRFDESEEQEVEEEGKEKQKDKKDGVEGKGEKTQAKEGKGRSCSSGRGGPTTTDFVKLDLGIGITSSRSTKGCSTKDTTKPRSRSKQGPQEQDL